MFPALNSLLKAIRIPLKNFVDVIINSVPETYWRLDETTGTVADDEMDNTDLTYGSDASTVGYSIASSSPSIDGEAKDIDANTALQIYDATPATARQISTANTNEFSYGKILTDSDPLHYYRFLRQWTNTNNSHSNYGSFGGQFNSYGISTTSRLGTTWAAGHELLGYYRHRAYTDPATYEYTNMMQHNTDLTSGNLTGDCTIQFVFRYSYNEFTATGRQHIIGCWDSGNANNCEWQLALAHVSGAYQLQLAHYQADATQRLPSWTETHGLWNKDDLYDDGHSNVWHHMRIEREDPSVVGCRVRVFIDNELLLDRAGAGGGNAVRSGVSRLTIGNDVGTGHPSNFDYSEIIIHDKLLSNRTNNFLYSYLRQAHSNWKPNNYTPDWFQPFPTSFEDEVRYSRPSHWITCSEATSSIDIHDSATFGTDQFGNTNGILQGGASSIHVGGGSFRSTQGLAAGGVYDQEFFGIATTSDVVWDWALNGLNSASSTLALVMFSLWDNAVDEARNYKITLEKASTRLRLDRRYTGTEYIDYYSLTSHPIWDDDDFHYFQLLYHGSGRYMELWIDGELVERIIPSVGFANLSGEPVSIPDPQFLISTGTGHGGVYYSQIQMYRGNQMAHPIQAHRRYHWWKHGTRGDGGAGFAQCYHNFKAADLTGLVLSDQSNRDSAHDITFASAPTFITGQEGEAVSFDGISQCGVIADHPDFEPATYMALHIVMRVSSVSSEEGLFQVYSEDTNVAGYRLWIDADGYVRFRVGFDTGAVETTDYIEVVSDVVVDDGEWHLITAWIYPAGSIYLWIDGQTSGYLTVTFTTGFDTTNYIRVGCMNDSGTDYGFFSGDISLLRNCVGIVGQYDASVAWGGGFSAPTIEYPNDPTNLYQASYTESVNTMINQGSAGRTEDLAVTTGNLVKTELDDSEFRYGFLNDGTNNYESESGIFPISYTGDWSILIRFKSVGAVTASHGSGIGNLISSTDFVNDGFIVQVNTLTNRLVVQMGDGSAFSAVGGLGSRVVADGELHTLILTHEDLGADGEAFAYFDGETSLNGYTITGGAAMIGQLLRVLSRSGGTRNLQNLAVYEIQKWDRLLTVGEIDLLSDNSTFLSQGNHTAGRLEQDFTIQCGFKIDTSTLDMTLMGKHDPSLCWSLNIESADTNALELKLFQSDATDRTQAISSDLATDGVLADGEWHWLQIRMDFSGTGLLKAWIDCTEVLSVDVSGWSGAWLDSRDTPIVIGNDGTTGTNPWNGGVDEVSVFPRALSDSEINTICTLWGGSGTITLDPLTLDVDVADVTVTTPSGAYTTPLLTATPTGGSGLFEYLWTSDGIALTPDNPTSASTTFSGTRSDYNTTETITCVVTDIGNDDDTAQDTVTTDITWESVVAVTELIMHHTFDNFTGNVSEDETANNHDATFEEAVVTTAGKFENAISISGSPIQSAQVVDHSELQPTALTFAGWIKPVANSDCTGTVFQSANNIDGLDFTIGGHRGEISYDSATNKYFFGAFFGTAVENVAGDFAQTEISVGVWSHVAYTYDGANIRLYVNGALRRTVPFSSLGYMANNYVSLFTSTNDLGGGYFSTDGEFDDFRYYGRALVDAEISELYSVSVGLTVDVSPNTHVNIVDPASYYTTPSFTATASGGSGSYTYLWTRVSGWTMTPNSPTSAITDFSGVAYATETEDVWRCTVTDTVSGAITEVTINIIINWDLV